MADSDQIKVVIRVRPLIQREQLNGQDARWCVQDDRQISQKDQSNVPPYVFDQIFDRDCSTWDLYGCLVSPIVDAAMNGYHGTVFAYGQSGSGKTHTMSGSKLEPGIIGLAMQDIFDFIEQKPSHEFLLRASYMEIYNEKIFDLLSSDEKHLKLQETTDHQISVVGLTETLVNTCEQVFGVIKTGDANRKVAETRQNDRSSRSHCIFRIIIESRLRGETDSAVIVAHLNFVDLAGSEKAGENSGDRFKEGCAINKSLFCLSQVIRNLSDGVGNQFIPYRDSKLTRILQNALGGNSKTAIICTINPTAIEESHSTLKFATRAKTIKNKPTVNEVLSDSAMLKKYRNEISRLTKLVNELGVQDIQLANEDLRKQLEDKQTLIKQLTQQIVVSSTLSSNPLQKKKLRRETWCGPKATRRSHFPSLSSVLDQRKITIREESALDLTAMDDLDLDLPRTTISFSLNNESRAKAFLRLSEGNENEENEGKMVSPTLVATEEGANMATVAAADIAAKNEALEKLEYEQQILQAEIQNLKNRLWFAEEENGRLERELQDMCDKRFQDITLQEWETLMLGKQRLAEEKIQLNELLTSKVKEVEELQKALAGQEPYIARLEQQLEAQMGAGNGQLGAGTRRRSGIPVEDKTDSIRTPTPKAVESADAVTSTEDLPQETDNTCIKSISITRMDAEMITEEKWPSTSAVITTDQSIQIELVTVDVEMNTDIPYPVTNASGECAVSVPVKQYCDADMQTEDLPEDSINSNQNNVRETCDADSQTDSFSEDPFNPLSPIMRPTRHSGEWCGASGVNTSQHYTRENEEVLESDPEKDKVETHEGRGTGDSILEEGAELADQLKEARQELEQQERDSKQLKEMLKQAQAELARYKEAMEAMEQADAERMEEISQIPRLKSQLARRDMEIQRLEAKNDRLKEELGHASLNSSLSSSFSEAPRRSVMLAEREAEVWQLKERLVRQAQGLDDLQQENRRLEDLVIELRAQLDEQHHSLLVVTAKARASSSFSPPATDLPETSISDQIQREESPEVFEKRAVDRVEMESLQRKLFNQESQISRLEAMLQERDDDIEILFEKNVMVPKDVAEVRIKEYEDLKQQVEQLEQQLAEKDEEIKKLQASDTVQQRISSQGEENSFQEQLVLDKVMLEDALQEKSQELEEATSKLKDFEQKLDERRNTINALRQEQEATAEKLANAEKLIADLKASNECVEAKDSNSEANNLTSLVPYSASSLARRSTAGNKEVKTDDVEESKEEKGNSEIKKASSSSISVYEHSLTSKKIEEDSKQDMSEILDMSLPVHTLSESVFQETVTANAPGINLFSEQQDVLDKLRQREQELLDLLAKKELEIHSLREEMRFIVSQQAADHEEDDPFEEKLDQSESQCPDACAEQELCQSKSVHETSSSDVFLKEKCDASVRQVRSSVSDAISEENKPSTSEGTKEKAAEAAFSSVSSDAEAVEEMRLSLERTLKELESIRDEKEEAENRIAELEAKVSELIASATSVVPEVETVEKMKMSLEMTREELQRVREEKDAAEIKVQELESRLSELTKSIKSGEESGNYAAAEKKESQHEEEMATLEELAKVREEREAAEAKVTELETKISELMLITDSTEEIADMAAEKKELEDKVQKLLDEVETLRTSLEQVQSEKQSAAGDADSLKSQLGRVQAEKEELTTELNSLKAELEQLKEAEEEMKAELTWQTQTADELHTRLSELEAEKHKLEADSEEQIAKLTQETEELIQEIEKDNQLLESSEQCQRVMEETLENHKKTIEKLEADNERLAEERDSFELKEEAAVKQQMKLKQQVEQLESRVAMLERQLESAEDSKRMLESALEDHDSAQRVKESLHQKLSQELQDSQAEILDLKATLSNLQPALTKQEARVARLEEIRAQLEKERNELREAKSSLEAETADLKKTVQSGVKKMEALEKEISSLKGIKEEKVALQAQVDKYLAEVSSQKSQIDSQKQQLETESSRQAQLTAERDQALSENHKLSAKLQGVENSKHKLMETLADVECRASSAEKECSTLREKMTQQSVEIEGLKKQLETSQARASAPTDPQPAKGDSVPLIEFKKMKMVLKNRIRDLTREVEKLQESGKSKVQWIQELTERLEAYEDPEKAENREREIETLTNNLKRKELELSYIQSQHKKELEDLKKLLSSAQETITYKESSISKLKAEIRRIRSEEVSFVAPSAPAPQPTPPSVPPSSSSSDERIISSHSGIIDRYTVSLLEADKYKLQKELKKYQERLKQKEAEVHHLKVALSKIEEKNNAHSTSTHSPSKDGMSMGPVTVTSTEPPGSFSAGTTSLTDVDSDSRLLTEARSTGLSPMGSPVDKVPDTLSGGRSGGARGNSFPVFGSLSSAGNGMDQKRDRSVLPSLTDKENIPQSDVLTPPHGSTSKPDVGDGESTLNIEPEFWKKPVAPAKLGSRYKSFSKTSSLSSRARTSPNECKSS